MTRIKLDFDGPLPRWWEGRAAWALAVLGWRVQWWSVTRSPSGTGWHVELAVAGRKHPWRIVALQAILGSDPKRELFNLARTAQWNRLTPRARSCWNVLFSRKWTVTAGDLTGKSRRRIVETW